MLEKCQKNGGLVSFVSKLVEVEKRLERAIAELEQVASLNGVVNRNDTQRQAEELDLVLLRTEELKAVHETVSRKIDATILRVKEILEG